MHNQPQLKVGRQGECDSRVRRTLENLFRLVRNPLTGAINIIPIDLLPNRFSCLRFDSFRDACSMGRSFHVAEGIRDGLRVECLEETLRRMCHDRAGLHGNSLAGIG